MTEYNIRTLITRGQDKLRCEDDFLVYEEGDYIITAVFDGCSSGIDSHFASTLCKITLKNVLSRDLWNEFKYLPEDKDPLYENDMIFLKSIIEEFICGDLNYALNELDLDVNTELLSTCVICMFNKIKHKCNIIFCGDGVCYIDGEVYAPHDENGNSVYYFSTCGFDKARSRKEQRKLLNEYFDKYCFMVEDKTVNETVAIASDGIDSFKDMYGINKVEEARDVFFKENRFSTMNVMLKRLYNIFIKSNSCINQDDCTIVRLNIMEL